MSVESEFLMLEKKKPKKTQYIQALQFYTCFFFFFFFQELQIQVLLIVISLHTYGAIYLTACSYRLSYR